MLVVESNINSSSTQRMFLMIVINSKKILTATLIPTIDDLHKFLAPIASPKLKQTRV